MCKEGDILGNKTNHNLCAQQVLLIFQAGVPENIIQQLTGHHSLIGLHNYEHTTNSLSDPIF